MNITEFTSEIKKLNIVATDEMLKQLEAYYTLLIDWNEKINLTNITIKEEVYLKHFYDSLTLNVAIDLNTINNLCDIGSGAGFPGIVLKIFFPSLSIVLVDSIRKKVDFLNIVIDTLNLKDITVVHDRAEAFAKKNREKYSIVTARAVAKLNILSELCLPIAKRDGYFLAMKGIVDEEIKESLSAIHKLGGKLIEVHKFELPNELSHRSIVKILKIAQTNNSYPRKFEKIKQKPL